MFRVQLVFGGAAAAIGAFGLAANTKDDGLKSQTDALAKIRAFAAQNTGAAPTLQDYILAGVVGVTDGVNGNLGAINDALASALVDGEAANTTAKVQTIVDAYNTILSEANGALANTTSADPTANHYTAIGVTLGAAADDADNLALLNDIVGASQTTDVDTIAEINNLARIANAIQTVAAGGTPSPALTVADLTQIGLDTTNVTTDNLPAIFAAIAAKNDDGSETDTLAKLQSIIGSVPTPPIAPVDLSAVTLGVGGFVINGYTNATDGYGIFSGYSISAAGDVNGDGLTDLIIGATNSDSSIFEDPEGRTFVVFGTSSTTPIELSALGTLGGPAGFLIDGQARGVKVVSASLLQAMSMATVWLI